MRILKVALVVSLLLVLAAPLYAQWSQAPSNKGLVLSFTLNKERYEPGEPVSMTFTVTNRGSQQMNFEFGGTPVYDIWITSTSGTEVWRYSRTRSFAGRQELRLAPGESKTYYEVWNQTDGSGKPLQQGWYEVYAKFMLSDNNTQPFRTRLRIDERLATGPIVLLVPLNAGVVSPSDLGNQMSIEGVLRQGPQGLYLEVKDVKVKR